MNIERLLCGCEMLWSDSGLVISVDTCAFCATMGLVNVKAARRLQGRESGEAMRREDGLGGDPKTSNSR